MSVFERQCGEAKSGSICRHIAAFYAEQSGQPPVFYIIEDDELPNGFTMKHTKSETGDDCHREVDGVSGSSIKKAFDKKRHWSLFKICDGGSYRGVTEADVEKWKESEGS